MLQYDFKNLPNVIMTGKTAEKKGWSHDGRSIEDNLLVIFHSGECSFDMLDKTFYFKAGDVALVPKNTFYKPYSSVGCEYTFFHFDGDFTSNSLKEKTPLDAGLIYGKMSESDFSLCFDYSMTVSESHGEVDLLLSKCMNTPLNAGETVPLLLSVYFTELMTIISKANFGNLNRPTYPATVNKIISFIQENYLDKFSLDELCSAVGVSKQYCMRVFKAHVNKTVVEYVTDLKMNHAVYLLRWTYMNVSEVADYLGFSDTAYFSRVFKKHHGIPPSKYFE